jgi:hypothetical protein
MLAGKAGRRQVLGSRRAAHRDRDIGAVSFFERAVGGRDFSAQIRMAGSVIDK